MLPLRQHRTSLLCDGVGLLHVFFFFNSFHLLKKKTTTFTPFLLCPSPSFFLSLDAIRFFFPFYLLVGIAALKKKVRIDPFPLPRCLLFKPPRLQFWILLFFLITFFFSTRFSFIPCRLIVAAIVESSIHTHTHRTVRGQPLRA